MVCGFLGCDNAESNPVIATLPPVLRLSLEEGGAAEWIRSTFQYAPEEVAAGRPGSETVLAKLSELLFVEAVRRYAESLPDGQTGWLVGLRDTHVARALALLHRDIARPWTVDELGRDVGLSRSALADRFTRLIGVPSVHYVASCRMQVTTQKLRNTSASSPRWPIWSATSLRLPSPAPSRRRSAWRRKKAVGVAPATWRRSQS
jgi:AraC-like DNA-binding protein